MRSASFHEFVDADLRLPARYYEYHAVRGDTKVGEEYDEKKQTVRFSVS